MFEYQKSFIKNNFENRDKAFVKNPTARYSEFIFGECSCDKLIDENQDPPIFDSSRREEFGL